MRTTRNASFALLVCVTLILGGSAKPKAWESYCGFLGPNEAAFAGSEYEDCAPAYIHCAAYETYPNQCRSLCLDACDDATNYSLSYCNVVELGGDHCAWEAGCVCNTDNTRH